jgi:hypothetical protein
LGHSSETHHRLLGYEASALQAPPCQKTDGDNLTLEFFCSQRIFLAAQDITTSVSRALPTFRHHAGATRAIAWVS